MANSSAWLAYLCSISFGATIALILYLYATHRAGNPGKPGRPAETRSGAAPTAGATTATTANTVRNAAVLLRGHRPVFRRGRGRILTGQGRNRHLAVALGATRPPRAGPARRGVTPMPGYANTGKTIRLGRILNPRTGRAAVVAFDHGLHLGAIPGTLAPGQVLETLAEAGADAFLVSPGVARRYASVFAGRGAPGLILRLDWTNRWRDQAMSAARKAGAACWARLRMPPGWAPTPCWSTCSSAMKTPRPKPARCRRWPPSPGPARRWASAASSSRWRAACA